MNIAELTVWTLMSGGLLSLTLIALGYTVANLGIASLRQLLFVILFSLQCLLLSGLAEFWLPGLPPQWLLVLQVGIGPMSSALGLHLLGIWLGGAREDRLVYGITTWGARLLQIAALVLMLTAALHDGADPAHLLLIAGAVAMSPVLPGIVMALRAHALGDPLSRWMALACTVLLVMIAGLHLHALKTTGFGLGSWILTAISAMLFLLITIGLSLVRERTNRRLARLAHLETGLEPATGLPAGTQLLSDVEHALWRAGRKQGKCAVICLYLGNLYAAADALGHTVDNQILAATAARIRRAAGFRCVVGLYQPRCFIIVFSIEKDHVFDTAITERLQSLVTRPLQLVGQRDLRQIFVPEIGLATLIVHPDQAQALDVINRVERLAIDEARRTHGEGADAHDTAPQHLVEQ